MSPKRHVLVSAALGGALFYATHSASSGIACFLAGTAIDVDHLYDYFRHKGFRLSVEDFLLGRYFTETGRHFIWLHSYELVLLLLASWFFFQLSQLWIGISVGLLSHLLCDQFTNSVHPLSYFLCYRVSNDFKISNHPAQG